MASDKQDGMRQKNCKGKIIAENIVPSYGPNNKQGRPEIPNGLALRLFTAWFQATTDPHRRV
jgi:hypothetical protein